MDTIHMGVYLHCALAALIAVATLNRETGILLVLLYALATRNWRWTVVYAGIWAAVYGLIRLVVGEGAIALTASETWEANFAPWRMQLLLTQALILAPLVLAFVLARPRDTLLRRMLWIVPLYGAMIAGGAMWSEAVRLLVTIAPVLLWWLLGERETPAGAGVVG